MIVLRPPGGRQRTDERTRLGSDAPPISRMPRESADGTGRCRRPGGTEGQGGPGRPHLARLGPGLAPTSPARMRAAPRAPAAMPTDAAVHDRARSSAGPSAGPTEPADRRHHSLRRCRAAARAAAGARGGGKRRRRPQGRHPRKRRSAEAPRKATAATAATAQADPDGRTRRARLGRRPWPARAAPRLPEPRKPQWRRRQAAAAARSPFGSPLHLGSDAACEDGIRCEDDGARLMMVRDGGVAWHPCASRLDAAAHAHGCAARLFGIVAIGTTLAPADSIYFT